MSDVQPGCISILNVFLSATELLSMTEVQLLFTCEIAFNFRNEITPISMLRFAIGFPITVLNLSWMRVHICYLQWFCLVCEKKEKQIFFESLLAGYLGNG